MVAVVVALLVPVAAQGATFNVNTTADSTVVGGCTTEPVCSLRDAMSAASASADPEDRVEVPEGPDVTIEGVTITGGVAGVEVAEFAGDGGGILVVSSKSLTLNQVAVRGNSAILNGGGIAAPPESGVTTALTISGSTISANKVSGGVAEGMGGGVYVLGDLTAINSTITGNSVENPGLNMGGGIQAALDPADLDGSKAVLLNTTIAGNAVAAGGAGGGFNINNPTAGVVTTFTVTNTIIAGNTANGATDCGSVVTVTSANSIGGDASCMFLDPASKQNTNPLIGPLADNGGPTDTMALLAGSPAIDAGTNTGCPATDQRGVARPQGSACDIGAYELVQTPTPTAASADLKLKATPKPKRFTPGKKLVFALKVSNRGPATATGVVVKGTVPALAKRINGPKVNKKKPCKLKKAKKGKRQFTCKLPAIAAGKAKTLKVVVKTQPSSGKLRVQARVRSALADPNTKDNKAKAVAKPKR